MTERIGIDFLRGDAMRAPNALATRDFYVRNWGLKLLAETPDTVYFRGTGPEHYIYSLRQDPNYGIDYINFGMASRERVDRLHARLVEAGAPLLGRPATLASPGGGYGFMALDPDNRRLRIAAGVASHPDASEELAKPWKVTHCVLNTPHMERTQEFYEQELGCRVSDYSANQMVFLRCMSDHHSIALNRGEYASVNHVAFEMSTIDSYMRGIGRMRTLGQSPAWGPGRHGPGNNPFAYFVSPSGFVIEFTAEVQQIDEASHEPQVWPRDVPEKMDVWMTAGPPTPAMRTVMQGRPDPGFPLKSG
jgi:catechol 2,3-dioxygenase-like lactoylglutathione lyase family enzyme